LRDHARARGFVLLLIPALVMRDQLRRKPLPVLDSSRATSLSLAIAGLLGTNALLATRLELPRALWVRFARVRDVDAEALAAMSSPREPMMAVRKTGASWNKEFRPTPHLVPKTIPGPAFSPGKREMMAMLLDDMGSLEMGAVLAARQAGH
jgi:hypothetical protein